MKSIRTRSALFAVCLVVVAMTVATLLGVVAIRDLGNDSADQMLLLLCESGEKNLDSYFESVEQSVETLASYVEADLEQVEVSQLEGHLDHVRHFFEETAYRTNGVLTYYYRIDPAVSDAAKGFWYVNLDGRGFREHTVTDISLYDTEDTTQLVWYTVPKATGKGVWLPPYITDNLDVRVISYNVPIYQDERFVGVVGIEIDYSTMARQVDSITLYENGYAFINDDEGTIIYHPLIDVTVLPPDQQPKVPLGLLSEDVIIHYTFEGVEKEAVWLKLENGMRLNVTVPVSEINAGWQRWINELFIVSIILLGVFVAVTMRFTSRITKPLHDLTVVAEQVNAGNYDVVLDYEGDDEVGILTDAFSGLIAHLKTYIGDLSSLAYSDALTSVHNKGAFDIHIARLQAELDGRDDEADGASADPEPAADGEVAHPTGPGGEAADPTEPELAADAGGSAEAGEEPDQVPGSDSLGDTDAAVGWVDVDVTAIEAGRSDGREAIAICVFDCNSLKLINDRYGHDKGNIYLKAACALICEVFDHSPVFRVGGDEFAAILRGRDFADRDSLLGQFDEACAASCAADIAPWEKVDVARGMAVYDPEQDGSLSDTVRRADKLMYENKRAAKRAKHG